MRRGEIYTAVARGDFTGKPRPVLIVQNDIGNEEHTSIVACLISTSRSGAAYFRIEIAPTPENGLEDTSDIQIDRIFAFRRSGFRERIGVLASLDMQRVDQALRRWLDL